MRLVFASNNAHKLEEVRAIMPAGINIMSLREIGFTEEIDETGTTLEENSRIKAAAVAAFVHDRMTECPDAGKIDGVFADDTGLEIDALHGAPGVYTARWYKMECSNVLMMECSNDDTQIFAANRAKALRELAGCSDRGAQFRTVITLIMLSDRSVRQVEGIVRGRIADEEYGEGGFGYDPLFIPDGYDKTFGELPSSVKNVISHRSRALQALVNTLQ